MDDWPEGVELLDRNTDLIGSDEDGFFIKTYSPHSVSETFSTRAEAIAAYRAQNWKKIDA